VFEAVPRQPPLVTTKPPSAGGSAAEGSLGRVQAFMPGRLSAFVSLAKDSQKTQ
jgi:hypothetical protein